VRAYDYEHHVCRRMVNRNRFYHVLKPDGQDMEIHTVAVKAHRTKGVYVKEVVQASVNDPWLHITDLALCGMGGYQVDWSPEKIGPARYWSYRGRWETDAYAPRCKWKLRCDVVNPEALQSHPRFRYCFWTPECGHPLDYLKAYAKHPRIELLSKVGLGWIGTRCGFVTQMERSKEMQRFVMDNIKEIRERQYGVKVIREAFRDGRGLATAQKVVALRREWGRLGLPRTVDSERASVYVKRQRCDSRQYAVYIKNCVALGLDVRDTKVAFPRQFNTRRQIVSDQIAEQERRKNAELKQKQDAAIAAVASKYAAFERARGAFIVRVPRHANDLVREGKRLHNCLGDGHYAAKMARGETVIAFVRRTSSPYAAFVAVEFSPTQCKVLQCYAAKNARPPAPVMKFVSRMFERKMRAA
jgi:hypothetical protein